MKKTAMILAAGLVAGLAGSANAFVPWSNPNGAGSFFTWSNGGSDNGFFGSPTLVGGDSFVFFPSNFRAQASNGGTGTKSDRLSFTLEANAGFEFSQITIREVGDYGNTGGGRVIANMGMFVTDLNTFRVVSDNATYDNSIAGFGNWTAQTSVSNLENQPPKWTKIQVVLNNNLIAIAGPNGVAFIEKKVTGGIIITVPTPGSLALMGMGGLVALRRRR